MKLERNEYLWYKASLAALGNEYLTKNWEVKLYATSLYNAMLWGRETKRDNIFSCSFRNGN